MSKERKYNLLLEIIKILGYIPIALLKIGFKHPETAGTMIGVTLLISAIAALGLGETTTEQPNYYIPPAPTAPPAVVEEYPLTPFLTPESTSKLPQEESTIREQVKIVSDDLINETLLLYIDKENREQKNSSSCYLETRLIEEEGNIFRVIPDDDPRSTKKEYQPGESIDFTVETFAGPTDYDLQIIDGATCQTNPNGNAIIVPAQKIERQQFSHPKTQEQPPQFQAPEQMQPQGQPDLSYCRASTGEAKPPGFVSKYAEDLGKEIQCPRDDPKNQEDIIPAQQLDGRCDGRAWIDLTTNEYLCYADVNGDGTADTIRRPRR